MQDRMDITIHYEYQCLHDLFHQETVKQMARIAKKESKQLKLKLEQLNQEDNRCTAIK